MKKILLFLMLMPFLAMGQKTVVQLQTQNNSQIKNKGTSQLRSFNMYDSIIQSSANLLGSYTNPSWITSLANTKITGLGTLSTLNSINNSNWSGAALAHSNIAATAVTPGSYTSANITVAADGSITAASNGSGGGTYTADESTLHLASTTFSLKSSFYSTTATASNLVERDANANILVNNEISNGQSIATAAGTTTFTVATPYITVFTGSTTQTLVMPVTSTLSIYQPFRIINLSTGAITINSSGGNLIGTLQGSARAVIVCTAITGTTAASWDYSASAINPMAGIGDMIQGGASGTPVVLSSAATGNALITGGVGVANSFGKITSSHINSTVQANISSAAPATTGTMNVTMVGNSQITITPTNNCTFNLTGGSTAGHFVTFYVTTSGTSSFTLTWGTNFKTTGTLATGTVTAKTFIVTFQGDGTNYTEVSRTTAM